MTIWYLARATGLVALIAFTMATAMGALATRGGSRARVEQIDRRFLLQMAHRSAAILGLLMLATHATLIIIDSFVDVSVTATLVPFTAGYRPLALGAGTLAVYAIVLAAVSGAMRGRLATLGPAVRKWRIVHLSAYLGWALSMGHGIFAGTDTGTWWSTAIYVACGLAVAAAVSLRWAARATDRHRPLTTARTFTRSTS